MKPKVVKSMTWPIRYPSLLDLYLIQARERNSWHNYFWYSSNQVKYETQRPSDESEACSGFKPEP